MPAATPASTPRGLSSTTTQPSGAAPMRAAACRKRSGNGFARATSAAQKIRPSKRSQRPVSPSVRRILSIRPLEATQVGVEILASASWMAGTGRSSARCAASARAQKRSSNSQGSGRPSRSAKISKDAAHERPM